MINFKAIGGRIRKYRAKQHLTQEQLAEWLNISVEYMSRIENGNCRASYTLIEKMSSLFQVDESELLFGSEKGRESSRALTEKIEQLSGAQREVLERLIDLLVGQTN